MTITLPPLPGDWECGRFFDPEELRARDIEVARVVLEGVARWFATEGHLEATWEVDDLIRNIGVKHG